MNSLQIKLGKTMVDLGDSKLSFVLTSPYPLMATGLQGGNFVFNFTLPATDELKKEFKYAHRPQAITTALIPYVIKASGIYFTGMAELTEADDDQYDVFCPVGNGDFNARAKLVKLKQLDLGGEIGFEDLFQVQASCTSSFQYGNTQPEFFYIEQEVAFNQQTLNLFGELNAAGSVLTFTSEKHINLSFGITGQFDETVSFFMVYLNGDLIKTFGLSNGSQTLNIVDVHVNVGDKITWKLRFESFSLDGIDFTIMVDVDAGSTIQSYLSQMGVFIKQAALNRYPDSSFAVFPLENPNVFDGWPDDFYKIDNENIKTIYSEIFKVINYWCDDDFLVDLTRIIQGVEYTSGNLFSPFPYIAYIIKQMAFYFNLRIINNIFEDELKYAVLVNHYIENRFINNDPKRLICDQVFNLADHVPELSIYDFLQSLSNLFGFGYEVDNNLNTIEFQFVDDIHKSDVAIDISHLLVRKPVVQFNKQLKGYRIEQKIPSKDKYLSQVKSLDGLNLRGTVDLLSELPLTADINDCFFVNFLEAYVIWNYDPDAYVFGWIFHSRKFVDKIESGEDHVLVSSDICPLLSRTVYDPIANNDRVWRIPVSYQASNFESAPEAFKSVWKPGIVWYHGLMPDSNNELYPYASAGTTGPAGEEIQGANLALTLDGDKGLFEKKWKAYINWRKTAKPVCVQIVPDADFLRGFKFKSKLCFGGVRYKVCDAKGNISTKDTEVWELNLLVD